MNVAIVDDSLIDRQHLYHGLERYCREHKVHMKIEQFDNGTDFLNTFNANVYNLVFLDIFLNEIDGMQVAKSIFDQDPQCLIIFTTSSKEHAVTAFRLHALDYLLKPFSYDYLEEAMLRYERASKRFEHYIELKEGRHYTRILLSDIIYTDYYNHYIQIHTPYRTVRSYMSFKDFSPMLEAYPQFLCCYRNCMVNLDHIASMDVNDFVLTNGERIPILRARRKEIRQAYANYIFTYVTEGDKHES